jgi:mono/diheme cytochrome c family protein
MATKGQVVFNASCASCHGVNAAGGIGGPPLIHNIYNPGHHANKSFTNAVRNGVRQHHWKFGDMPPQKHIAFGDLVFLMKFIREVQQQNGITTVVHKM